jgi:hypothetical protein
MDKNKFWLGGRLFNTASPRLGAPTQRKARPQDGRPNATQGTSVSWAPQRNTTSASCAPQRTSAMQMQGTYATQGTSSRLQIGRPNATQGTSTRWMPKCNARHVCKLGAPTQRKARLQVGLPNARPQRKLKARPQVGRPNATQGTSARWASKRKTHPQRKRPHKGALG